MEAPEKIYIPSYTPSLERGFAMGCVYKMKSYDIEYIRADLAELKAGDIMDISNIAEDLEPKRDSMSQEEYCKEAARRFNEQRRK